MTADPTEARAAAEQLRTAVMLRVRKTDRVLIGPYFAAATADLLDALTDELADLRALLTQVREPYAPSPGSYGDSMYCLWCRSYGSASHHPHADSCLWPKIAAATEETNDE